MIFEPVRVVSRILATLAFTVAMLSSAPAPSIVFEDTPDQPFFANFIAGSKGVRVEGDIYFDRERQRVEFSHPLLGGSAVLIVHAAANEIVLMQPAQRTFMRFPANQLPLDILGVDWTAFRRTEVAREDIEGRPGIVYDVSGLATNGAPIDGRVLISDGIVRRLEGETMVNGTPLPGRIDLYNVIAIDAWEDALFVIPDDYRLGLAIAPR